MKLRQVLASVMGTAVAIGSVGIVGVSAADVSQVEGINVAYHTRSEIRDYLKNHPFDMDRQAEYAQAPVTWRPFQEGRLSDTDLKEGLNALNSMRYIAGVGVKDVILCHYGNDYAQAGSLACCVNGSLSHNPAYIQGMDSTLWTYAKFGCQQSNLASGFKNVAHSVVLGYLYDTNERNISALGHRRWCLNPPMDVTGFGQVNNFSAMYALANGYKNADNYGVCWPAQNMPLEYFPADTAWSISMGYNVNAADVEVTLTRKSDGEVWTFSNESADGYFNVNNEEYGQTGCIIFRPDGVEKFSHGDVYSVKITGLNAPVSYNVSFFGLDGDDSIFADDESDNDTDTPDDTSAPDDGSDIVYEPESKDYIDEATGIEITAEAGTFPAGTTLKAEPVESGCTPTRYTCDLSFICGGRAYQPMCGVNVRIPMPVQFVGCSDLYVYHIRDNTYNFVNSSIINGCVSFCADSFSPYVISSEKLNETGEPEKETASDVDLTPTEPTEPAAPTTPTVTVPDIIGSVSNADDTESTTDSSVPDVSITESSEVTEPSSSASEPESETVKESVNNYVTMTPVKNPATGITAAFLPFIAVGAALFVAAHKKK